MHTHTHTHTHHHSKAPPPIASADVSDVVKNRAWFVPGVPPDDPALRADEEAGGGAPFRVPFKVLPMDFPAASSFKGNVGMAGMLTPVREAWTPVTERD